VTRRALGRGRFLVIVGSFVALIGMVPVWWVIERTGLPSITGNGFEGAGLVVFLCCLAMLAVIVLPFASRDGDSALDRAPVYFILLLAAAAGYVWRLYDIIQFGGFVPAQTIGLWVTGGGLLIIAWGIGDIFTERPRDSW
jgi:hypothetical protein